MSDFSQFERDITDQMSSIMRKHTITEQRTAHLGNGEYPPTVIIPPNERTQGRTLYCYIEKDGSRETVQVANTNPSITFDSSNAGLPVIIGKTNGSSIYQIISVDPHSLNDFMGGALPSQVAQKNNIAVTSARLHEANLIPSTGMTIGLTKGAIRINDTLYFLDLDMSFLDLTSYIPATTGHAKLVAIYHDGSVGSVVEGTSYLPTTSERRPNMPTAAVAGKVFLGVVYLYNGQTEVKKEHIFRLQVWHSAYSAPSTGHTIRVNNAAQTARVALNFLDGNGIDIVGTDDAGNNENELTFTVNQSELSLANLGTKTLLNLSDTPAAYTGAGLQVLRVNSGETGVEFADAIVMTDNTDPSPNYLQAKLLGGLGIDISLDPNPGGNRVEIAVNELDLNLANFGNAVFLDLDDTPASYTSQALKGVRVNAGATGLEFYTRAFTSLTDTFSSYSGLGGYILRVNSGATGIEAVNRSLNLRNSELCEGRLSLDNTQGLAASDKTSIATLYYHAYTGNRVALYESSNWVVYEITSSPLSISLAALTADTNYDVFIYSSGGSLTLETVAWSSDTSRSVSLTRQHGIYLKGTDTTRRYLGTIRIDTAGGTCTDSIARRYVWNFYNREETAGEVGNATGHTYTSSTVRGWNNDTTFTYAAKFIWGIQGEYIDVELLANMKGSADGDIARLGWGLNSNTAYATNYTAEVRNNQLTGYSYTMAQRPRQGYNFIQILESCHGGTASYDKTQITYWGFF